jgi:malate dehydrogenase
MTDTRKVTVVGAGAQGAAIAQRIAECDAAGELVLADVVAGRAEALAADLNQCRALTGHRTRAHGTVCSPEEDGYDRTAGSDLVVIAAGRRPEPDGDRLEHMRDNLLLVTEIAEQALRASPDAVVLVATNPVAELSRAVQRATGLPPSRVIGQSPALDTARFTHFVAEHFGVQVQQVRALTLGWHGEDVVPVVSGCTVQGRPLADLLDPEDIEDLTDRARYAGAELSLLLRGQGGLRAPALAAANIARAVLEDSGATLPVCAWVDGAFGIEEVWLGVEAELGIRGVNKVWPTPLSAGELAALRAAAEGSRVSQRQADALMAPVADPVA